MTDSSASKQLPNPPAPSGHPISRQERHALKKEPSAKEPEPQKPDAQQLHQTLPNTPQAEKEDDTLYNAIIIALIIGIIIVIATLILSRPAPETFTEIYFENHQTLPKFIQKNTPYNYTFTIASHENASRDYKITTSTDLYKFNYNCESPAMYFDSQIIATEGINNITRRIADTKDPVALIREDTYSCSFDQRIAINKTGRFDTLRILFKAIDGSERYSITLNDTAGKATITALGAAIATKPLNLTNATKRYIYLSATDRIITLSIDKVTLLQAPTPKGYTGGFLTFETIGINTEIPWIALKKGNSTINNLFAGKRQECRLLLINSTSINQTRQINKDTNITIHESFTISRSFDIAKLQIGLDSGEEIHFWMAQI